MPDWLTTTEAAARLRNKDGQPVTVSYVKLLIRQGRIPASKFGKAWMIPADFTVKPVPLGRPRNPWRKDK